MNQKFEIILRDEIVQKSFIFTARGFTPHQKIFLKIQAL